MPIIQIRPAITLSPLSLSLSSLSLSLPLLSPPLSPLSSPLLSLSSLSLLSQSLISLSPLSSSLVCTKMTIFCRILNIQQSLISHDSFNNSFAELPIPHTHVLLLMESCRCIWDFCCSIPSNPKDFFGTSVVFL